MKAIAIIIFSAALIVGCGTSNSYVPAGGVVAVPYSYPVSTNTVVVNNWNGTNAPPELDPRIYSTQLIQNAFTPASNSMNAKAHALREERLMRERMAFEERMMRARWEREDQLREQGVE